MVLVKEPHVFGIAYQLYKQSCYQQAYSILTDNLEKYPHFRRRFYEWRLSMAALLGNLDLAENILEAALNEGIFFGVSTLRKDADLKELQGRARFEALVARDMILLTEAQKKARPSLTIIEAVESNSAAVPLVMALHGNHSNANRFRGYWNKLPEKGWLVALPQSSQVSGNDCFSWNDQFSAKKELITHYCNLTKKYTLDPNQTVLAGFSKGAFTGINAALQQYFPIKGFIAVAPSIGDIVLFEESLASRHPANIRGYFLLGEEDKGCNAEALQAHALLNEYGIPCGLEMFHGIGHAFPLDYRSAVDRALAFILQD